MNVRLLCYPILAVGIVLLCTGAALAHRVNVFAWVESDTVFVESKYPDGTKVHQGAIRVLDSTGKELLNGKTNDQGEFSFKVPAPDDLTIVLEAGMGHRAEWPLSRQDIGPSGAARPVETAANDSTPVSEPAPPAALDQAIEKALDKKLAPMMKMLAEMHEQRVQPADVFGGIGYIFGLAGVAAYFKRKP
jgi:nickel transport protein